MICTLNDYILVAAERKAKQLPPSLLYLAVWLLKFVVHNPVRCERQVFNNHLIQRESNPTFPSLEVSSRPHEVQRAFLLNWH